jgi:hypothetical protein
MIGPQIETVLGVFGDSVFARYSKGNLYAATLSGIPATLEPEMEADELKWTVRRKLTHTLLRPTTLTWTRESDSLAVNLPPPRPALRDPNEPRPSQFLSSNVSKGPSSDRYAQWWSIVGYS